jgi:hypothetical protein
MGRRIAPLVLMVVTVFFLAASPTPSIAPFTPNGWMPVPHPKDSCEQTGREQAWKVSMSGDSLVATAINDLEERDPLPFKVNLPRLSVSAIGDRYDRHVLKVDDGWLVGFDNGEWDGSLWWFSSDGAVSKVLIRNEFSKADAPLACAERSRGLCPANVHEIVDLSGTYLAFTGLAHLGLNYGDVSRIVHDGPGDWKAEHIATLAGEPIASSPESASSLLVLTPRALIRVNVSGATQSLHTLDFYGTSVAVDPAGRIFIGTIMNHMLELSPSPTGYDEQWFSPTSCPAQVGPGPCHCGPVPTNPPPPV